MESTDLEALIRPAKLDDVPQIFEMIQALIAYQKFPPTRLTLDELIRDGGFEDPTVTPRFHCFVAEQTTTGLLLGYTLGFFSYSTWEGRSFLLEDIFVRPDHRRCGIGARLATATMAFAVEHGCGRFDFHVLARNAAAREFYEELGAVNLTEKEGWLFYNFSREAMRKLIVMK